MSGLQQGVASNPGGALVSYEIVPSSRLPVLDLSRSLGEELFALATCAPRRKPHAVTSASTGFFQILRQSGDLKTHGLARYFLAAFIVGNLLGGVSCLVPRSIGGPLAVVALALTVPGSLLSLALLRFDMLKLLLRSYDFWFYSFVNTVGAILLSRGFQDARSCVAAMLWLGNIHSVLVDANTRLITYLVKGSSVIIALNAIVLLAIETESISGWHALTFKLREHRSNLMMCNSLISNCLTTLTMVLARNMYRRHFELREQRKIGCTMLRCLNYRCRVSIRVADRARIERMSSHERIYDPSGCPITFPISDMRYVRCQEILDGSDTFFPVQLDPLQWPLPLSLAYVGLGAVGLAMTAGVFAVYPSMASKTLAVVGLVFSMLFLGISLGLLNRRGSRLNATSFDYIFISLQLSFGLLCGSMLFNWDERSIALASMWLWLHWVISIDALTPLMKHKIRVHIKALLVLVLLLFVAAEIAVVAELIWRDRWGLQDKKLVSLAGRVTLWLMPFFASRLVLSFLWSLRLIWRISSSHEDDAVIQLGRMAFPYRDPATESIPATQAKPETKAKPQKKSATVHAAATPSDE